MQRSTRLGRNLEKQGRKQLLLFAAGIIVLLFLAVNIGPTIIAEISSVFNEEKDNDNQSLVLDQSVNIPILNSISSATNSSSIILTGHTQQEDGFIEVFLNGLLAKEIEIKDDRSFEITLEKLKEGENFIKARYKAKDDKVSDFTEEKIVSFSKEEPKLEISFPSDGQEFKKGDEQLTVKGKTEPVDNKITVNGFKSIVDGQGNFSHYIKLNEGENNLVIEAESESGIKVKKEIKVRYSP